MRTIPRSVATIVAALALALTVAPLAAQTLEFSGHGNSSDTYDDFLVPGDFSFQYFLPQSPTPDHVELGAFGIFGVTGTFTQDGSTHTTISNLLFFTSGGGGGFWIDDGVSVIADVVGPQLFSGATDAPIFTVGTYTGVFIVDNANASPTAITDMTISDVSSAPEPSSMALLGTGLFGLIPIVRRRRK